MNEPRCVDSMTALEAKERAQWIAYAPFVFHASRVARDSGILGLLEDHPGLTAEEVAARQNLPRYGVRVLLDAALSIGLVTEEGRRYRTTKTAHFLTHDALTRVNMDFTHDVSYAGLTHLSEAIETGTPAGLKVFGEWRTIYEALPDLPAQVRKSWLGYDHYYSDRAFPSALPLVFKRSPKRLLDVGGNTGRWALACLRHDAGVRVTVLDLPGPLEEARAMLARQNLTTRADFVEANLLDETTAIPQGYDAIWMSQFLDCFSEQEIVSILSRCRVALEAGGRLYILEPFSDRQRFRAAAFCMRMMSLYFAVMANGNSRFYESGDFIACVQEAGLDIEEQHDHVGAVGHTLLVCRKAE
jgi:ubiquinone/menaquinone biosynthesis C-methylase UbiE